MEDVESFNLTAKDGTTLYGQEWSCETPSAVICLVHGLGEHIGRYQHVAAFFNTYHMSFLGMDLRGHGRSKGKRGHCPSYDSLLEDVEELLMYARAEHNDLPIFLYGHSLGGNVIANYVLRKNTNELKGAIISSPWLKLAEEPATWKIRLAAIMSRILPSFTQPNGLIIDYLTHDDTVNQAYVDDPLVHDKISVNMFTVCYREGFEALENAKRNKLPLLIFHGADDQITSPSASERFAKNAGGTVIYQCWKATQHEPHNDLKQKEVMSFMLKWMQATV